MRVFSPAEIEKVRRGKSMSFGDFMRALSIRAPAYGVKPAINHIRNIINGKSSPGPAYLALFADVLGCETDDFFVEKEPKRRKR